MVRGFWNGGIHPSPRLGLTFHSRDLVKDLSFPGEVVNVQAGFC